jgi:cytochrome c biogenesis protein CcmG/thiol:disulfide interchange protein DsbE
MASVNRIALVVGAAIAAPLGDLPRARFRHDPEVIESPLIGTAAPEFVLRDFDGGAVGLRRACAASRWSSTSGPSWCQPCVDGAPGAGRRRQQYAGRVAFVGRGAVEDTGEAVGAIHPPPREVGPVYHDADGKVSIAYGVFKLPETYFAVQATARS